MALKMNDIKGINPHKGLVIYNHNYKNKGGNFVSIAYKRTL